MEAYEKVNDERLLISCMVLEVVALMYKLYTETTMNVESWNFGRMGM